MKLGSFLRDLVDKVCHARRVQFSQRLDDYAACVVPTRDDCKLLLDESGPLANHYFAVFIAFSFRVFKRPATKVLDEFVRVKDGQWIAFPYSSQHHSHDDLSGAKS